MKKVFLLSLMIALVFTGCDKRSASQLYTDAETLIQNEQYEDAIEDLVKLTEKYPDNEMAPKSIYRLAELYMNKMNDLEKAILTYKQVADVYTESVYGPKGRFMSGFLLANNTDRMDDAKVEYELFVADYPNHELIEAVKFELDNLGKSIDDIPQLQELIQP